MEKIARLLQPLLLPTRHHFLIGRSEIIYLTSSKIQKISEFDSFFKNEYDLGSNNKPFLSKIYSFHNGMRHTEKDFVRLVSKINQISHPHQVLISIYNPSSGAFNDFSHVALQNMNVTTEKIINLASFIPEMISSLRNIEPDADFYHFAHSEAGIICDGALKTMPNQHRELLKTCFNVVTLGSPRPISKNLAKTAINIYSESDYLVIPFVKIFEKKEHYQFKQIVSCSPKEQKILSVIDHSMDGASYLGVMKDYLDKGSFNEYK